MHSELEDARNHVGLVSLSHGDHALPSKHDSMTEWRISDENALRESCGLEYQRSAALHNHVVKLGWIQRDLVLDTLDKRT